MYCQKCGNRMDDHEKFCVRCGAQNAAVWEPEKAEAAKIWPLVFGIISIALSLIITLQSCAVGLVNSFDDPEAVTGTTGMLVAVMILAGGIVLIATRKRRSRVAPMILYGIGAVLALFGDVGIYEDLVVWGVVSLVIAVLCLVSTVRAKLKKK